MLKDKIYVIHSGSTIESLYTLFPLIISRFNHLITYIHVGAKEAFRITGHCVILVRVFKGNDLYTTNEQKKRDFIENFRKRFDRVIMLDDGAGSDNLHFEYMDLVDLYYKGKLLRDRTNYLQPMYGRQLFTNYYHEQIGVVDKNVKTRPVPGHPDLLNKLRVSWNLGCGIYPPPSSILTRIAKVLVKPGLTGLLRPWFRKQYKKIIEDLDTPVDYTGKLRKVQARFGNNALPETIGYQRKLFRQICIGNDAVLFGKSPPHLYNSEMKEVMAVLSPFGWGEVCFRDFEAIKSGALLIKPDMSHLETWPDVYIPGKTYLPVSWNGENLAVVISSVLNNNADHYAGITETARRIYRNALQQLDDRVHGFLKEATNTNPEFKLSPIEQVLG